MAATWEDKCVCVCEFVYVCLCVRPQWSAQKPQFKFQGRSPRVFLIMEAGIITSGSSGINSHLASRQHRHHGISSTVALLPGTWWTSDGNKMKHIHPTAPRHHHHHHLRLFPLFLRPPCAPSASPHTQPRYLPSTVVFLVFPSNWTDMPLFSVPWICGCNPRFLCAITHIHGGSPGGGPLSYCHELLMNNLIRAVRCSPGDATESAEATVGWRRAHSGSYTHIAEHKQQSWQAGGYVWGEATLKTEQRLSCWWPDTDQRRSEKYIHSQSLQIPKLETVSCGGKDCNAVNVGDERRRTAITETIWNSLALEAYKWLINYWYAD